MFKEISQGFSKFFSTQRVLILVIFFILAFVLYNYSDSKASGRDGYTGKVRGTNQPSTTIAHSVSDQNIAQAGMYTPSMDVNYPMGMAPSMDVNYPMGMAPSMDANYHMGMAPSMDAGYNSGAAYIDEAPAKNFVVEGMDNINEGGYHPQHTGHPNELLPSDHNQDFNNFNMMNKGNIVMPDLLDAGYLIGLDTVGQSLRNANYQERSDPVIPKMDVGPWNNSTIEPDLGRVPLEIGSAMR